MNFKYAVLSSVLVISSACGCRSVGSLGSRMSNHGMATKQLGDNWNRGSEMVKKGEKLQTASESLSSKSAKKLAESERLIAEGQELMQASESAFDQQVKTIKR